jgi:RimJ/RimL family protein N-acetyltransferase
VADVPVVAVRPATGADSRAVWEWRNDPVTRAVSVTTGEVPWAGHSSWFAAVLADPSRHLLVGWCSDERVGVVRFDALGAGAWEVSVNLAPAARGRRLAVPLLLAARTWLGEHDRVDSVKALVSESNEPSLRTFRSAGYTESSTTNGWTTLTLH